MSADAVAVVASSISSLDTGVGFVFALWSESSPDTYTPAGTLTGGGIAGKGCPSLAAVSRGTSFSSYIVVAQSAYGEPVGVYALEDGSLGPMINELPMPLPDDYLPYTSIAVSIYGDFAVVGQVDGPDSVYVFSLTGVLPPVPPTFASPTATSSPSATASSSASATAGTTVSASASASAGYLSPSPSATVSPSSRDNGGESAAAVRGEIAGAAVGGAFSVLLIVGLGLFCKSRRVSGVQGLSWGTVRGGGEGGYTALSAEGVQELSGPPNAWSSVQ